MDYKEKYNTVLERAKNFIENGDETERTIAESIFAGIMEKSEDEKIRKDILCYFEHYAHDIKGADVQKWIDWLEKQDGHLLDPNKVIKWLRQHICAACWDKPDEAISERIEQFKKDFEL